MANWIRSFGRNHQRLATPATTALKVHALHGFYGRSHALQGVDLTLEHGVHAIVGRNGMGKTTLCNAIMGLLPERRGSISFRGEEIIGFPPHRIASLGIGYTPQGRRLWPSLTVDEHLRLGQGGGAWTQERIYETFPRLHERRRNTAAQLSGGEQQMLAISRALMQNPSLLILDEPTEGLAPVIVDLVQELLSTLVAERSMAVLLIEQNIAVATAISETVGIMVNGRIMQVVPARQLAADRALQERLLGVGRGTDVAVALPLPHPVPVATDETDTPEPDTLRLASDYLPPTRWSMAAWQKGDASPPPRPQARPAITARAPAALAPMLPERPAMHEDLRGDEVYVVGTFDTKGAELSFIRDRLVDHGLRVRTVDLSTFGRPSMADIPPHMVAGYHPGGANAVFTGDRGASVSAMADAFESWMVRQRNVGGIISAGGSGGTALVSPGMRSLPVGVPKIIISTVGSGDVGEYVGSSDIMMMYSVIDILGLNRISRRILANGAGALAGMVSEVGRAPQALAGDSGKPGLGLTMFGVTTRAVQQIMTQLTGRYDCMVFHATGTGGRSMEKLADSALLAAAIDLTTTEVCDMLMGGVFPATKDRFGAFIRTRIPYVGSVGALDMVNFGPRNTVPGQFSERLFVEHNPQVTLMRTTPEENEKVGQWIAGRLNEMSGPVRFLLPEGGVSALDAPGQPFHAPDCTQALFRAITGRFKQTSQRRLIRTPHHINDPAFAKTVVDALDEIDPGERMFRHAAL